MTAPGNKETVMPTYILNIHDDKECQAPGADKAIIRLTYALRNTISQMAGMVRALCIFSAADLNETPQFMIENMDAFPLADGTQPLLPYSGKMKDTKLVVTARDFFWEGSYANGYRWKTDCFALSDLNIVEKHPYYKYTVYNALELARIYKCGDYAKINDPLPDVPEAIMLIGNALKNDNIGQTTGRVALELLRNANGEEVVFCP
jgi:hypothetical protein